MLDAGGSGADSDAAIEAWSRRNAARIERALSMVADIKSSRVYDMTTLPVALREIRNLVGGGEAATPLSDAEPALTAE